ncbi:hypothetical protein MHBO_000841 [Bonamia ostreae]|uniref:Uncharacterized protein n=1 Tax=Bonamia ostreae TaxID=126728 RepID=A0ABV2AH82_9EUKA
MSYAKENINLPSLEDPNLVQTADLIWNSDFFKNMESFLENGASEINKSIEPVQIISKEEIPTELSKLLVNKDYMTSTLSLFYNSKINIEKIKKTEENDILKRSVKLNNGKECLALGFIKILLNNLGSENVRHQVVGETAPFGTILKDHGFKYGYRERIYIKLPKKDSLFKTDLFGRATIMEGNGVVVATVAEILPYYQ